MSPLMTRLWPRLTLLQRFTLLTAAIALGLAVGLSVLTVRAVYAFAIDAGAYDAAELVIRTTSAWLDPTDFRGPLSSERQAVLDTVFRRREISGKILSIHLWRLDGQLLYSNISEPDRLPTAVAADLSTDEGYRQFVLAREGDVPVSAGVARVFVPVSVEGEPRPVGAFEIYYDLAPLNQRLAGIRRTIWTTVPAGLLVLYASVFVLMRRTSQRLLKQQEDLVAAHLGTYRALASAIDLKDSYTGDHSLKVARLAGAVARAMGLGERAIEEVHIAAHLHDLGKIAVPDAILMKPGPLSPEEYAVMEGHAAAGFTILRDAPLSEDVKQAIRHNHERWDGSGYPDALAGEHIPLLSRILGVVDAYEAMTSDRPYRRALPQEEAIARLRAAAGTQFDPAIVAVFLRAVLKVSPASPERTSLPLRPDLHKHPA
jgi:putative nucleotidyltransferase with HDIG domain